jgi:hypothetical protein
MLIRSVASWPRATRPSASEIPGETWPPGAAARYEEPAHASTSRIEPARRERGPAPRALRVDEDAEEEPHQQEVRQARADEGQRHALRRQQARHDAQVDDRLQAHEEQAAGREQEMEQVRRPPQVGEAGDEHDREHRDDAQGEPQPELLAHHGEDEVGVRLRQEVDLLAALAEPGAAEVPPAANASSDW